MALGIQNTFQISVVRFQSDKMTLSYAEYIHHKRASSNNINQYMPPTLTHNPSSLNRSLACNVYTLPHANKYRFSVGDSVTSSSSASSSSIANAHSSEQQLLPNHGYSRHNGYTGASAHMITRTKQVLLKVSHRLTIHCAFLRG